MSDELDIDTLGQRVQPSEGQRTEDLTLTVLGGPDTGCRFQVPPEGGVLGREDGVEFQVRDPAVSRRHAIVECIGPTREFYIRDLDSLNGIHIDGRRVSTCKLVDGARIQLSEDTVLRVRFQDPLETEYLDELQRAATVDALTGVRNRRYLMSRLDEEFAFALRNRIPMSVLLIDVDHFKGVNDEFGHQDGDNVLREVAQLLRETTRREDIVARYGGEEFVVINRGYTEEPAMVFGERLARAVRETPIHGGTAWHHITVSIGVSCFDPAGPHVEDKMDLLVRADSALYEAKRQGRDRVCCFSDPVRDLPAHDPVDEDVSERHTARHSLPPAVDSRAATRGPRVRDDEDE